MPVPPTGDFLPAALCAALRAGHPIYNAPMVGAHQASLPRTKVRDAIDDHLQHAPTAESKGRIKRLRDLRKPQYRLRVDDLRVFYDVESKYLVEASEEQIVITKHGKPAGALTGFGSEDDWFDFRLENDPRFFRRIAEARASVRDGQGVSWEQVKKEDDQRTTACTSCRVRRRK